MNIASIDPWQFIGWAIILIPSIVAGIVVLVLLFLLIRRLWLRFDDWRKWRKTKDQPLTAPGSCQVWGNRSLKFSLTWHREGVWSISWYGGVLWGGQCEADVRAEIDKRRMHLIYTSEKK